MRDILQKNTTLRTAVAQCTLQVSAKSIAAIQEGRVPKGDPLTVAKVAGILAAKGTPQLIPYCHQVPIESADISFELLPGSIVITATIGAIHKTGVEMEALTAASVAALNLYDMLKMIDEEMSIEHIVLLEKRGGKSDLAAVNQAGRSVGIIVVSDSTAKGQREDQSGALCRSMLEGMGLQCQMFEIVPDDVDGIQSALRKATDELRLNLVVFTGGTGLSKRDVTREAVGELIVQALPGVEEAMRSYGQQRTPFAMLSRSLAGVRSSTIVLCLPGSVAGVRDGLNAVCPALFHAFDVMEGAHHN
jgi:cyclic pyranopterin phosphate synthase